MDRGRRRPGARRTAPRGDPPPRRRPGTGSRARCGSRHFVQGRRLHPWRRDRGVVRMGRRPGAPRGDGRSRRTPVLAHDDPRGARYEPGARRQRARRRAGRLLQRRWARALRAAPAGGRRVRCSGCAVAGRVGAVRGGRARRHGARGLPGARSPDRADRAARSGVRAAARARQPAGGAGCRHLAVRPRARGNGRRRERGRRLARPIDVYVGRSRQARVQGSRRRPLRRSAGHRPGRDRLLGHPRGAGARGHGAGRGAAGDDDQAGRP